MSMSKKDYEAVAALLRPHNEKINAICAISPNENNSDWTRAVRGITVELASLFAQDNPRFRRDLFMAAATGCDPEDAR